MAIIWSPDRVRSENPTSAKQKAKAKVKAWKALLDGSAAKRLNHIASNPRNGEARENEEEWNEGTVDSGQFQGSTIYLGSTVP